MKSLESLKYKADEHRVHMCVQVGADHLDVKVDSVVAAMAQLFALITGRTPRFGVSQPRG